MNITKNKYKKTTKFDNPFKTIKRILSYVLKYKFSLFLSIIGIIISSVSRISRVYFLKKIVDEYLVKLIKSYDINIYKKFIYTLIIMLIVFLISCIFSYLYNKILVDISNKTLNNIRKDLFNKIQTLPISFFDENKRGEIMSLYTDDLNVVGNMVGDGFTDLLFSILNIILLLFFMTMYSFQLTIMSLIMLFLIALISKIVSKRTNKYFKEFHSVTAKLNGFIEEVFNGEKVVKVFSNEKNVMKKFDEMIKIYEKDSIKYETYTNILGPIMGNLSHLNYLIVSIYGIILISKHSISIGMFLAFLQCLKQFAMPIRIISQQINSILDGIAGGERIFKVIDINSEIDEGKIEIINKNNEYFYKIKNTLKKVKGKINFNNVSFKYNTSNKNILNNINVEIKSKQKIAFIGSTGAGKTTITNLINRFYDITDGSITIDDINIKDIKKSSLRSLISIVFQDINLFSDTIKENIKYSKSNSTDNEIINASKLANADYFIQHLPKKYDTILTSNATNLSQGEKQLIAIARAIIANKPILILDEATSSIDTRTEKLIEKGLSNLMKNKTSIIIAHRLSTVKDCDVIYVLDNGKIIEYGNHTELLEKKGKYYQFYNGITELD